MAEEETERLRLEIIADDKTAAVVAAVKAGYQDLALQQKQASDRAAKGDGFLSKIVGGIGMGVGMGIAHAALENVREVAREIPAILGEGLHEAISDAAQVHDLGGQFLLLSDGTKGFGEMREAAKAYHEEIEALGASAGKDIGQLSEAFNDILYASEKTTDQTMALVEDMAMASKVVPGGIQAMTDGMRNLEMGVVKAKNPVVQLIAATDTLHGNAKEVAKQLTKMSPKEQAELAERAIAKMAERAKKMPMSFNEMATAMKNVKDMSLEALGYPIHDALMPYMRDLTTYLQDHREEIEDAMAEIGEAVAGEMKDFADITKGTFRTLQSHSKDFKDAGSAFASFVKPAVEGLKIAALGMGDTAALLARATNGLLSVPRALGGMNSTFGDWYQKHHNAAAGESAAKAFGENPAAMTPDQMRVAERMTKGGVLARGGSQEEADRAWAQAQTSHRIAWDAMGRPIETAAAEADPKAYASAFENAAAFHDEAAMEYAATVIAGSKDLQKAFVESRTMLDGGYQPLIDLVKGKNREFAEQLVRLQKDQAKSIGQKTVNNFYGGIQIKQDFRDNADPDRIIQMFKRDIAEQAINRRASRLTQAFGF